MIGLKETLKEQLFEAVHNGNTEEVIRILGLGISIDIQDDLGRTPIFLAAMHNNLPMIERLADLGADLEIKNKLGDTILRQIVSKDSSYKKVSKEEKLATVKLLIKKGAKLTTFSHDALPIHIAIQSRCSLNIVKTLLTKETINKKNCLGRAPLHLAVLVRRADIVKLLIAHGADINIQEDREQNTPLMLTAIKGDIEIAILLLTSGAGFDLKNSHGQTFFDLASLGEMKSFALNVMCLLSAETKSEDELMEQLCCSHNHNQISENMLQSIRSILSDLKFVCNTSPNPNLSVPSTSKTPQPGVLDLSSPESSISDTSQLSMLDVSSSESSISEISQGSTSIISGSSKSSFSGSFTNRFQGTLNIDPPIPGTPDASQHSISAILDSSKSSFSGSFTNRFQGTLNIGSPKSIVSEISQYEYISSPGSSISEISQYEYISSPGYSISEASRRRNISPPMSIISESTRSSIDSFSPSGSYAVDSKRRKLSYTLL